MSEKGGALEIHVYLADGTMSRFVQEDAALAQQLLDALQPAQIFKRPEILIGGSYSMTIIPTDTLARVDFVTDRCPDLPFPARIKDVVEITPDEFSQRLVVTPAVPQREERTIQAEEPFVSSVELLLRGSGRLYLQLEAVVEPATPVDRALQLHRILEGNATVLAARRRGGGAILINPEHVLQMTLCPGPPETPPNAWRAHHPVSQSRRDA